MIPIFLLLEVFRSNLLHIPDRCFSKLLHAWLQEKKNLTKKMKSILNEKKKKRKFSFLVVLFHVHCLIDKLLDNNDIVIETHLLWAINLRPTSTAIVFWGWQWSIIIDCSLSVSSTTFFFLFLSLVHFCVFHFVSLSFLKCFFLSLSLQIFSFSLLLTVFFLCVLWLSLSFSTLFSYSFSHSLTHTHFSLSYSSQLFLIRHSGFCS